MTDIHPLAPKTVPADQGTAQQPATEARQQAPPAGGERFEKSAPEQFKTFRQAYNEAPEADKKEIVAREHPVDNYLEAFDSFSHWHVKKYLGFGSESVVFELADPGDEGNVLKTLRGPLLPNEGKRYFDLPVVEQGSIALSNGRRVFYIRVPKAEFTATKADAEDLKREVEKPVPPKTKGNYWFWDYTNPSNVAFYKGKRYLADYRGILEMETPDDSW